MVPSNIRADGAAAAAMPPASLSELVKSSDMRDIDRMLQSAVGYVSAVVTLTTARARKSMKVCSRCRELSSEVPMA